MKNSRKLSRSERNALKKMGYENLESVRYIKEDGDEIIFVREDPSGDKQFRVNKKLYYSYK